MSASRSTGLVAVVALVAACGGSTGNPTPITQGGTGRIAITPGAIDFDALGLSAQLSAAVKDDQDQPVSGAQVAWSSKHTGVIQVSAGGMVTAIGNGTDTVVATSGGVKALLEVHVQQVPAEVAVTPALTTLTVLGGNASLTAAVKDRNQRSIAGAPVTWSSSNPAVLPVDASGKIVAAGVGTAVLHATSGTLSGDANGIVSLSGPVGNAVVGGEVPCTSGFAGAFPCSNISLLSYLPLGGLGIGNHTSELNDLWGWTDASSGKEYALVGRTDGLAFVDLSTPTAPRYLGYLPMTSGAHENYWRDVKVYHDHAFVVSDGAGPHGMQVFDLHQLRTVTTPQVFSAATTYRGVASVHNIAIDEASGYAYLVGSNSGGTTCGGGLHMVDIRNPTAPTFAGCFADVATGRSGTGYTHDVQCVMYTGPDATYTGHEICFGSNETALSIADVTNKAMPTALSHAGYPGVAYTHQGWLSTDQRWFFTNDELDELSGSAGGGTRTLIWDVSDLDDPLLVAQYHGPTTATDHNNYVYGSRMSASNYQFGVRVLNVADPVHPTQVGFFDTAPELPNVPGFGGSWSNYPFFASGILVVTSSAEGLFVLRAN